MKVKKRILVAPLNWGIGHATRCIPIINALIDNNYEVIDLGVMVSCEKILDIAEEKNVDIVILGYLSIIWHATIFILFLWVAIQLFQTSK